MRSKARRRSASAGDSAAHSIQPAAAHELHDVEGRAVGQGPDVVDGDHPRVLERGEDAGLAMEPAREIAGIGAGAQDLQGDVALQLAVVRAIDDSHPAAADLLPQLVPSARVLRRPGDPEEVVDRRVGQRHEALRPRRRRASSANSSSLAVRARRVSSMAARNSRRADASRLVTWVGGTPNSAASAA